MRLPTPSGGTFHVGFATGAVAARAKGAAASPTIPTTALRRVIIAHLPAFDALVCHGPLLWAMTPGDVQKPNLTGQYPSAATLRGRRWRRWRSRLAVDSRRSALPNRPSRQQRRFRAVRAASVGH